MTPNSALEKKYRAAYEEVLTQSNQQLQEPDWWKNMKKQYREILKSIEFTALEHQNLQSEVKLKKEYNKIASEVWKRLDQQCWNNQIKLIRWTYY